MISLFTQHYVSPCQKRYEEILKCIETNKNNKYIDRVVLLETPDGERPTYNDFFKLIETLSNPDDINIICNSDIYFDDTIRFVNFIKSNQVILLSRWEKRHNNILILATQMMQDVWIFRNVPKNVNGDIKLGIPTCDWRIAYEFKEAGYEVLNFGKIIKGYHLHQIPYRTYTNIDGNEYRGKRYAPNFVNEDYLIKQYGEDYKEIVF